MKSQISGVGAANPCEGARDSPTVTSASGKLFGIHMSAMHHADVQLSPMLCSWLSCLRLHLARRSLRRLLTPGLGGPGAPQSGWTPGVPEIHCGIVAYILTPSSLK